MSPTPGELKRIAKVVADLLARSENSELTAEELAAEVSEAAISTFEEIRANTHNMIILGHFRLDGDQSFVAAVGPLSTRASVAAREIGERFAWDWRTKRGTGKFVRVPLIRDPRAAWDAARGATPIDTEHLEIGAALEDALSINVQDQLSRRYGPTCICGLPDHPRYNSLGDAATMVCPLHPERTHEGEQQGAGRADGGDPCR